LKSLNILSQHTAVRQFGVGENWKLTIWRNRNVNNMNMEMTKNLKMSCTIPYTGSEISACKVRLFLNHGTNQAK